MPRLQIIATGILMHSIPSDVGKLIPHVEVSISTKIAIPVNPPDKSSAGRIKACITKACKTAEITTARNVMTFLTAFIFCICMALSLISCAFLAISPVSASLSSSDGLSAPAVLSVSAADLSPPCKKRNRLSPTEGSSSGHVH